jgi:cell division protein FtsQ
MWDKPDHLNGIANLLFAAAFALALGGALHYAVRLPLFALREVTVSGADGTLTHVTLDQVEDIVKNDLHGNFFTLNITQLRTAFERLPWVRKVATRRQWPDRIAIELEEHMPLARWGNAGLVNSYGEIFAAAYDGKLPVFVGPQSGAKEMAIQYGYFLRSVAVIGQVPTQVQLSPRRAWQLRLDSGLVIELGRERIESRLDRFVAAYARTTERLQRRLEHVDLRYSNGFAVRFPELQAVPQAGVSRRGARGAVKAERNR